MTYVDDVHTTAEKFLRDLGVTNIPSVTVRGSLAPTVYGETLKSFTKRVEEERAKRYELAEIPVTFVLKDRIRYFYGFKGTEPKWTYDERLAFKFTEADVENAITDLGNLGVQVVKTPTNTASSSL